MSRSKMNRLSPLGLVCLAIGLLLHNWMHGDYAESISGFLIGISLAFMIVGSLGRKEKFT